MNVVINRTRTNSLYTQGTLSINGEPQTLTIESTPDMLPARLYRLQLVTIHAHLHQVERDSTYHQYIRYDSIYIYQSHEKDYRRGHPEPPIRHPELVSGSVAPDTVVIKDISIEYRYKLLRDTTHIIQRDSIPYPVTVVETREVRYTPWWSKALAWVGALCLAFIIGRLALKRP